MPAKKQGKENPEETTSEVEQLNDEELLGIVGGTGSTDSNEDGDSAYFYSPGAFDN